MRDRGIGVTASGPMTLSNVRPCEMIRPSSLQWPWTFDTAFISLISRSASLDVVVNACDPSAWEVDTGGQRISGHLWIFDYIVNSKPAWVTQSGRCVQTP